MALSKLNQATKSITKSKDYREDIILLMQPYANWEQYLMPAPMSISLLGQLVRISAEDDFSIGENPPTDGFKFIRYPNSFRACLFQVCNGCWQAFNEAQKNMDQIRLYTGQVPEYIKNTVGIIIQEEDELVQAFLPAELRKIAHISDACLELAVVTEKKFSDVIKLMQELVETLVNAKQGYDEEMEKIKTNIEVAKIKEVGATDAKKRAKDAFDQAQKTLSEDREAYKKAMSDLPSGWNLFSLKLMSSLSEEGVSLATGYAQINLIGYDKLFVYANTATEKIISFTERMITKASTTQSNTNSKMDDTNRKMDEVMAANNIFAKSKKILTICDQMQQFYKGNEIKWPDLYDQEKKSMRSNYLEELIKSVRKEIHKQSECQVKTEAMAICDNFILILTELANCAPQGKCEDDKKTMELISKIENVHEAAEIFYSKSKAFTNQPPFHTAPPHSSQQEIKDTSASTDVVEMYSRNARLKIELTEVQLKRATEQYQLTLQNLDEKEKELNTILIDLKKYDLKKIDFNTRIVLLAKGLEIMGQVKEQWEKLVQFFQMVSNIVKTTLSESLNSFKQTVEIAVKRNYTYNMFIKDNIYTNALNAYAYANLVYMMSTTYTEVSVQYLMNSVSVLGKLMTMDPKSPAFLTELERLEGDCTSARNGISSLAAKNKKEFETRCQERVTQIKMILLPELSPLSEKDRFKLKKVIDAVKEPSEEMEETKPETEIIPLTEDLSDQYL